MKALFSLGGLYATPGDKDMGVDLRYYLKRHVTGDWRDMTTDDQEANEWSVEHGARIFSAFDTPAGRLWVITEADRSVTTCLLPDEY